MKLGNGLLYLTVLILAGTASSFYFWRGVTHRSLLVSQIVMLGVAGTILIYLLTLRHELTFNKSTLLYFLLMAPLLPMTWIANTPELVPGPPWSLFHSQKLIFLITSALAPPRFWVGMTTILAFVAATTVEYFTFSQATRAQIIVEEPWGTWFFGAMAAVVLLYRLRSLKLERRYMRSLVKSSVASRFAARLLAIKDLINTPLQTIKMNSGLIRRHHPSEAEHLDRIDRSVNRIDEVNKLLCDEEQLAHLTREGLAFDAVRRLRGTFRK